jgi:hypothetical protein
MLVLRSWIPCQAAGVDTDIDLTTYISTVKTCYLCFKLFVWLGIVLLLQEVEDDNLSMKAFTLMSGLAHSCKVDMKTCHLKCLSV